MRSKQRSRRKFRSRSVGLATTRLHPFLGLALMVAGGLSNLVDRLFQSGAVTDFMVLRLGPLHTGVFNLADVGIVLGTVALAGSVCAPGTPVSAPAQARSGRRPKQ
jgi:hypothetical protein